MWKSCSVFLPFFPFFLHFFYSSEIFILHFTRHANYVDLRARLKNFAFPSLILSVRSINVLSGVGTFIVRHCCRMHNCTSCSYFLLQRSPLFVLISVLLIINVCPASSISLSLVGLGIFGCSRSPALNIYCLLASTFPKITFQI